MGNGLRHNEKLINNPISTIIISIKEKSLNADEQINRVNNNHEIPKKDSTKPKYRKLKGKNSIYANINRKNSSNYKTQRENINYKKYIRLEMIKYFIISILFCHFCSINSLINLEKDTIYNRIAFHSYEIKLKLNGTGVKNILSSSSYHNYPCPSYIYLKNELVSQEITNCHYINITESNSEIILGWNDTIINTTRGMFYNCREITEIDMTNFDTSLVTDMSDMFAYCSSLISLNLSNVVTSKVETFENMFLNCLSLTSLNLESFTNPSATSLSKMFYGCINLEYINIKNFEEIENIQLDDMFYNIPQNAVICLLSCPPPTNFTISSMNKTQATISWVGYELNKFIISYGIQNLSNPEEGIKINVTGKENFTFTNLNLNQIYDVYIKTDCDSKSSYWIGPLLISIGFYNMSHNGTNSIITCSKVIYDSGGPNGDYQNYEDSTLTIYPETPGKFVSIKGIIDTEIGYDYLYIYNGNSTGGNLFGCYEGNQIIPLFGSTIGPLTIKFTSDLSILYSGFELVIGCIINSQTIYYLIKENKCRTILCDNDWRNKKNIILPKSGLCVKNCNSTNQKYHYKGKCYDNCPINSINRDFICYSKIILGKCEEYSLESDYFENLFIKCKEDYYPKLNDINNNYTYIDCYKNNSLEKYYLDINDLYFKSCYESCKTCNRKGTKENHNCITCDNNYISYKFNLTSDEYYNCYSKCKYYYYFDINKNYYCSKNKECPHNYINLIEEKNQCIDECYNDPEYKYNFRKKCYKNCPEELSYKSELKNYYCEAKCSKDKPLEIIEYQNCTNFCGINEMNNKSCISKFKEMNNTNGNLILRNIIQDITYTNFDTLFFLLKKIL